MKLKWSAQESKKLQINDKLNITDDPNDMEWITTNFRLYAVKAVGNYRNSPEHGSGNNDSI